MAITKMNRYSLICFRENKRDVLKNIQRFGDSEFINLQTESNTENDLLNILSKENYSNDLQEVDLNISLLRNAIKFVTPYSEKESGLKAMREGKEELSYEALEKFVAESSWEDVCSGLLAKQKRLSAIDSELVKLLTDVSELKSWKELDIAFNEIKDSKWIKTFVGTIPGNIYSSFVESMNDCELVEYKVLNNDGDRNIVVLAHKESANEVNNILRQYEFAEYKYKTDRLVSEEIEFINKEIEELKKEQKDIIEALKAENKLDVLKKCETYFKNLQIRTNSNVNLLGSDKTVVLSGWIPVESNSLLEKAVSEATNNTYILDFVEVKEEEDFEVPVKLKNNFFNKSFESITSMYSTPNYKGIDPTPLLAPFYMCFFGMMVGDFGYGAILTLATILALTLFKLDDDKKNFAKLFMWLGVSTTAWGLIYGAGFGDAITFDSLLDMNNDIMTIMIMSIGFGVVQILVALGIKAYTMIKAKDYFGAFADVGIWLITFAGIAMFALKVPFGGAIMAAGMVGIVLTNGRDAKGIGGKLGSGAYALYGITGYVGDLVSYTRLMALGVAGGSIASAMNLIIGYLPSNILVSFVLVPVLFVLLHVFNMLLGLLGAYVHSCRLQYVEYFGKFYEGGGKEFKPFKMDDEYIKIK